MIVTTTENIANRNIKEMLGIVQGSTIRARHMGSDILAGLKNIVGGELKGYSKMINQARNEAFNRMIKDAENIDADAIINIRFSTSMIMAGASEILVYGTAVKLD